MTEPTFTPSDNFWPSFIRDFWEQTPSKLAELRGNSFVNLTELFSAVVAMPGVGRSDRFWVAKVDQPRSRDDFVFAALDLLGPKISDHDFAGFFQRINRHTAGINIHDLDKARPDLRSRIQEFIDRLDKISDQPVIKKWVLDTFFGTYRATPFGIHKDSASVFAFSLMGQRTYYTWPPEYFTKANLDALHTPDLNRIRPHLKNAEAFHLQAGDVFYWPSNRWHVVLSDGAPSVVAQISAYFARTESPNKLEGNHQQT